jgi:hypothetical protein
MDPGLAVELVRVERTHFQIYIVAMDLAVIDLLIWRVAPWT